MVGPPALRGTDAAGFTACEITFPPVIKSDAPLIDLNPTRIDR
jgi:hypothetical protein